MSTAAWSEPRRFSEEDEMSSQDQQQLPLPDPVATMVAATNAGDSERFLSAFAADAVVDDWGRRFEGRDRIAEWNAHENIGVDARFSVKEAEIEDGHVVLRLDVSGRGYNGPGTFTVEVASGLITSLTIR
jgi:ketosteroid isomerase-like protein